MENVKSKFSYPKAIVISAIIGLLAYGGWQQAKEYKQAPFKQQVLESQREAAQALERQLEQRRNVGFVETVKYANAFNEVVGVDYNIIGRTKGSTLRISQESDHVKSVCFSVFTGDDSVKLFAPLITIQVYAKFDGGETKSFSASRGRGSPSDLCIDSTSRFMYNLRNSNEIQVALPFLEYSNKITKIYEFNLKTFNGIAQ